jgi:undecaprenol kinase
MREQKNSSLLRRVGFAFAGMAAAFRSERTFRIQVVSLACVIIVLSVSHLELIWWAVVAMTGAAVLSAELFNTALEHLADRLHPEIHPQIAIVKDCAAGAVLVAACGAVAVGVAVTVHLLTR